jgi:hypothetical protein
MERRLTQPASAAFWSGNGFLGLESLHKDLHHKISNGLPFSVGRLGAIEARIVLWGKHLSLPARHGISIPVFFSDTRNGPPNAGIRPRSRAFYRRFADLAYEGVRNLDYMGVWKTAHEFAVLRSLPRHPGFFDGEMLSPTMPNSGHWLESLEGKRVLVFSPFKDSIERQLPRMGQIWRERRWNWRADFSVVQFPYLIDDDCPLSWVDVLSGMVTRLKNKDYDVALFGCGGLGMPLAAAAKSAGRIGIQMGGHLQLLFGIYGRRHLEQEWHSRWINDSWVRPTPGETPKTAWRVEDGCYW